MDWLRYANQGATRNQPISPDLANALGSFLPNMGVTMEVFSGGQPAKGSGGARVGSTRHDHGNAADVFFYQNGRRLDWANPQDVPIYQDIVRQARAAGVTGFGAGPGYMQPGAMHIGYGNPGVWGAGGRGSNAPGWLTEAYNGAAPAPGGGARSPATSIASLYDGSTPSAFPGQPRGTPLRSTTKSTSAQHARDAQGAVTGDPKGIMGRIASLFMQDQQRRQQAEQEVRMAEEERRRMLLSEMFV